MNAVEEYSILHASERKGPDGVRLAAPKQEDDLLVVYETADGPPVGTQKSAIVHSAGLLHRTATCWVINSSGKLLLLRRPQEDPIQEEPDRYDVPVVAHLHANEGPEAAISRKLADEFGVAVPGNIGGDKAGAAGGNDTADTSAGAEPLLFGPITPLHEHRMQLPCCVENELTESFVLQGVERTKQPKSGGEAVFLPIEEVQALLAAEPNEFTQRFKSEVVACGWFKGLERATKHSVRNGATKA